MWVGELCDPHPTARPPVENEQLPQPELDRSDAAFDDGLGLDDDDDFKDEAL